MTDKQIEQFQKLYKTRFGIELTKEEALEKGLKLINLLKIILKPINEEEYLKLAEYSNR